MLIISFSFEGGLLVCLPPSEVEGYCAEVERADGCKVWVIGEVVEGERVATISENVEVIEV